LAEPTLVNELAEGANVAFDADSLIYFFERHDRFHPALRPVFTRLSSGTLHGHISYLTLLEVLVGPLRAGLAFLAQAYTDLSTTHGFSLHALDLAVAEEAASLRARLGLRAQDAVVAATATQFGCTHLITNDSAFRRIIQLNVLVISDFI
jgi:predicted nucleic acid-binding protein